MKSVAETYQGLAREFTSKGALLEASSGLDPKRRPATSAKRLEFQSALALGFLLAMFVGLQLLLPLGTAIKIGADEDYELSKATLCNHGYKLYSEIWNDQPPLITFVIANLLKHVSSSVLAPRLLTVGFSLLLLSAVFILIRRTSGLVAAAVGTAMLMASPGFLELSCSVMQEIPALAPVVAASCVLWVGPRARYHVTEIIAGLVFGFGLQMKMIGAAYLPIAGVILWLRGRGATVPACSIDSGSDSEGMAAFQGLGRQNGVIPGALPRAVLRSAFQAGIRRAGLLSAFQGVRRFWGASFAFGMSMIGSFVALNYLTGNSLILELQQSWAAHFASARSFDYGSPEQYPYDWTMLIKNWETTLPAILGVYVLIRQARRRSGALVPIAWLGLTLLAFTIHKPWWAYYYVHNALPLCWCAGVGIAFAWERLRAGLGENRQPKNSRKASPRAVRAGPMAAKGRRTWALATGAGIFGLCAAGWAIARVDLEVQAIRRTPKLYSSLALKEIQRFRPFTKFMFSDQPIYSFHADLPIPPHLAVLSLKRLWSGDMDNMRLAAELTAIKPGLILLHNSAGEAPFEELLNREYRLVYQDNSNRVYANASISRKPPLTGL